MDNIQRIETAGGHPEGGPEQPAHLQRGDRGELRRARHQGRHAHDVGRERGGVSQGVQDERHDARAVASVVRLELETLKQLVENQATNGGDVASMGFELFVATKLSKAAPEPPASLIVRTGTAHGKARVAVAAKGYQGVFVAQVSPDPITATSWTSLPGAQAAQAERLRVGDQALGPVRQRAQRDAERLVHAGPRHHPMTALASAAGGVRKTPPAATAIPSPVRFTRRSLRTTRGLCIHARKEEVAS